jgi:hypothetical protein
VFEKTRISCALQQTISHTLLHYHGNQLILFDIKPDTTDERPHFARKTFRPRINAGELQTPCSSFYSVLIAIFATASVASFATALMVSDI